MPALVIGLMYADSIFMWIFRSLTNHVTMKKAILFVAGLALALLFTHCTEEKQVDERTLITKKIQYDVPIVNLDPNYDWWIKNIAGADREELINNIFDKVLAGEIQAYDYFLEPLSRKGVESMLVDTLMQTLMRSVEPYEEYDTMIITRIEPGHVTMLRFLEEWKYDESSLQIDKKVFGISPVLEVEVDGQRLTRPLFWIFTDEELIGD